MFRPLIIAEGDEMEKSTKDFYQYGLATVLVLGYFVVLWALLKWPVPAENKDAVNILFGILSASVGAVVGYFFGSSKGSAEKNEMLAGKP